MQSNFSRCHWALGENPSTAAVMTCVRMRKIPKSTTPLKPSKMVHSWKKTNLCMTGIAHQKLLKIHGRRLGRRKGRCRKRNLALLKTEGNLSWLILLVWCDESVTNILLLAFYPIIKLHPITYQSCICHVCELAHNKGIIYDIEKNDFLIHVNFFHRILIQK
jgi:hypothetical protein